MLTFNLSKTEFVSYLDCPLKFYLLKQQNLHTKQGPRANSSSKFYRNPTRRGIRIHKDLKDFFETYGDKLQTRTPPPDNVLFDPVLKLFWEQEAHRLEIDEENWLPLALETYIVTPTIRGIIDRIDIIDTHSIRLVEYKSSPGGSFLNEELLFYALLVSESEVFQQNYNKVVTQGAVYYYDTGDWLTRDISEGDILDFKEYLDSLREEMLSGNWVKRFNCEYQRANCFFATVCTKVPDELLREPVE